MRCLIAIVLFCSVYSLAQKPVAKKLRAKSSPPADAPVVSATPKVSDSFAKAGLKALFAIRDDSSKTKEAMEDVQVEMDSNSRPDETLIFADLTLYSLTHENIELSRESLRLKLSGKMCNENRPGCRNPITLQEELEKDPEYLELIAKDGRCMRAVESELRARAFMEDAKNCPK